MLIIVITNYSEKVKQNYQGSFFLLPPHGKGGARVNINNSPSPSEKFLARGQLKKCLETFSVLLAEAERRRAETLGGIIQNPLAAFCSKTVRILTKRRRQFSEFGFWAIVASPRQRRGLGFGKDFEGIFEIQK